MPRAPLAVRLAALLHDLGKPQAERSSTAARSAEIDDDGRCKRLRYPTGCASYVTRLVRAHSFPLDDVDELFARRFLREHGDELAFDLVAHKEADLAGSEWGPSGGARRRCAAAPLCSKQERWHPHRLEDLAVDGSDLLELGYSEGPELGRTLEFAARRRGRDPALNTRDAAARARASCLPDAMTVPLLRWEAPGPYEVAFSTRHGGVSEGRTSR